MFSTEVMIAWRARTDGVLASQMAAHGLSWSPTMVWPVHWDYAQTQRNQEAVTETTLARAGRNTCGWRLKRSLHGKAGQRAACSARPIAIAWRFPLYPAALPIGPWSTAWRQPATWNLRATLMRCSHVRPPAGVMARAVVWFCAGGGGD